MEWQEPAIFATQLVVASTAQNLKNMGWQEEDFRRPVFAFRYPMLSKSLQQLGLASTHTAKCFSVAYPRASVDTHNTTDWRDNLCRAC